MKVNYDIIPLLTVFICLNFVSICLCFTAASSRVLMGMARRGDAGLSDLFLASFDSAALDPATFDAAFFAENAAALVKEELEKGAKK